MNQSETTPPRPLQVLAASSSEWRRRWYLRELGNRDFEIQLADNGLECMEYLRHGKVDALILEPELLWGGTDGVLAAMSDDRNLHDIPVIIISSGGLSSEIYRSSIYLVQGFFGRVPRPNELADCLLQAVFLAESQYESSFA